MSCVIFRANILSSCNNNSFSFLLCFKIEAKFVAMAEIRSRFQSRWLEMIFLKFENSPLSAEFSGEVCSRVSKVYY